MKASTTNTPLSQIQGSVPEATGRCRLALLLIIFCTSCSTATQTVIDTQPEEEAPFVDLAELAPGIRIDMRYSGSNNFLGRTVTGYEKPRCLLTRPAAEALAKLQQQLKAWDLSLIVYDCYRPQHAVDDFVRWSQDPGAGGNKADYYPAIAKGDLFDAGYIARRSGHSRGSTVDLSLLGKDGAPLPMGSRWDFFGTRSHTAYEELPAEARRNRLLLLTLLREAGFGNYAQEWWHYTLEDEPYPDRYFNLPIAEQAELP